MNPPNNFSISQITSPYIFPIVFFPSPLPSPLSIQKQQNNKPSKTTEKERI